MTNADDALRDFTAAWEAGTRPRVEDFLARMEPAARDDFLERIDRWLDLAPDPVYDEGTRASIAAEPDVADGVRALREDRSLWPDLLPRLRERRGVTVGELAHAVFVAVGLPAAPSAEARIADWLDRMEHDTVDPDRVTGRVLDALADALDVSRATLEDAGDVRHWRPARPPGPTLWRSDADVTASLGTWLDAIAAAGTTRVPPPNGATAVPDAVDVLFTGGREG